MLKVIFTPGAEEDLHQLANHITDLWGQDTAKKILEKIIAEIDRLTLYPLSGISLGTLIEAHTKFRYLFVEKNYVFYYLESEEIRIIRVLLERQDFMNHLFEF